MSYRALLFCPDEKTARVVTQVLSELEFSVESCSEPFAAVKKLMAQHFDALVVDCDNEQNAALLFKSARNSGSNQASLSVAVVEGQTGVAKAFRLGANLVLTKPINVEQSKGTLRVARGLLRKSEAAKPAVSGEPFSTQVTAQFPVPPPRQSAEAQPLAVSASAFELEAEPAPAPGPAEAALLEYMPESVPSAANHAPPAAANAKQYPWQPASRPQAEPMASALRRAAEAAGKSGFEPPATNPVLSMAVARSGAAAAPAPAKEVPLIAAEPLELKPPARAASAAAPAADETPTFSSLEDREDQKSSGSGSSTKKFLAVVAVLAVIGGGYVGWTKMQSARAQQSAPQVTFRPETPVAEPPAAETPVTEPPAASQAPASQPVAPTTIEAQPEVSSTAAPQPEEIVVPLGPKPASSKPSAAIAATTPAVKSDPSPKAPAPIVVKKNLAQQPPAANVAVAEPVEPPAPMAVATNADDKALSAIMSTTSVAVPKPAPQTLKISKGVSEGLLVTKVAPVYPAQARSLRVQGKVELQAYIGKDGNITNVKQLAGDPILGRAAMDAVHQWKYKPYYLNGEPVEIQTQITVNFKLP